MDGAMDGAATLGAALGDPADEAHAATTSGMIRIEYRIRIAIVLLFHPTLALGGPLAVDLFRGR